MNRQFLCDGDFFRLPVFSCLFRRKSQSIVITRSSCKNFNVAHFSKSTQDINAKLGTIAHHDKMELPDNGHKSESYISGVMALFIINFYVDGPWQTSVGTTCGAVILNCNSKKTFKGRVMLGFVQSCVFYDNYMKFWLLLCSCL